MPEICEIAITVLYLNNYIKNKCIENINILNGRYLKNNDLKNEITQLHFPLKIKKIQSKGKFIYFTLKQNNGNIVYLFNTLGLKGKWVINGDDNKHNNVSFNLNNDILYFNDFRNFGTLKFVHDKELLNKQLKSLAPDFLQDNFTYNMFKERFNTYLSKSNKRTNNKSKNIYTVLMDQKLIGSGLGNYLVAEILYRSKINVYCTIDKLYNNDSKLNDLFNSILFVVKLCYLTNNSGYISHLKDFKVRNNYYDFIDIGDEKFEFKVYGKSVDMFGNEIVTNELLKGRNAYWCPKVQLFK